MTFTDWKRESLNFFYLDESTINPPFFCLRLNGDNPNWKVVGRANFNILPARMLGVDYCDYLQFCKEKLDARIFGKDCEVPYVLFRDNQATRDFVKYLNEVVAGACDDWTLMGF